MIVWPEVMYDAAEICATKFLTLFVKFYGCKPGENWLKKQLSRTLSKRFWWWLLTLTLVACLENKVYVFPSGHFLVYEISRKILHIKNSRIWAVLLAKSLIFFKHASQKNSLTFWQSRPLSTYLHATLAVIGVESFDRGEEAQTVSPGVEEFCDQIAWHTK